MKVVRITSTAILSLLLGIAALAYAQHEDEKQDHAQQQGGHEQGKPQQQHAQQQRHEQQEQHNQQQAQHRQQQQNQHNRQQARQQPQRTQQQQRIQQSAWQPHRSQNWQSDHRTWQRGGYRGYRIPDDRYRGYFGPSHRFRINGLPFLVVGGYPRFQYQGYWISTVDPWPETWGNDWYDNDDVYVNDVDNGYYLFNRSYPGQGIAINITL